ncbi:MAG: hypothetical protein RR292_07295 [Christensenellaceae bacterium]
MRKNSRIICGIAFISVLALVVLWTYGTIENQKIFMLSNKRIAELSVMLGMCVAMLFVLGVLVFDKSRRILKISIGVAVLVIFQIITMVLFEIFFLCIPIALELLLLVLFIIKKNCCKGHIVKAIAMILCVVLSGLYLLFLCAMLLFIVVDRKSDALFIMINYLLYCIPILTIYWQMYKLIVLQKGTRTDRGEMR